MAANLKWTLRVARKIRARVSLDSVPTLCPQMCSQLNPRLLKAPSPTSIYLMGKKWRPSETTYPFSSQHLQTHPHLPHAFLLSCYMGKDGPLVTQMPSQDLKLSLSVPILSEFRITPAAKRILPHLPGPTIISQENSQVQAQLKAMSHAASWLWSP